MRIKTTTVKGRRNLCFESIDAVVADAQLLADAPHVKMLGNWPLGQIFAHLAGAMNGSIDGITFKAPWYIRMIGTMVKSRCLTKGIDPGFELPKNREPAAFPPAGSVQEAFEKLHAAAGRIKAEPMTARHPVFGHLTSDEWYKLHLRHAELHLSFAVPE